MAWQPTATTEHNTPENVNPVIRIPVALPMEKRTSHGREEKGVADKAGNPEIRVPKKVKSEGLCARDKGGEERRGERRQGEKDGDCEPRGRRRTRRTQRSTLWGNRSREQPRDPHGGTRQSPETRNPPRPWRDVAKAGTVLLKD
ncbi:hypothetical protein NDU88_004550 [Pleurodeles waltl]|uniref:Uncharacterized protein n=1 Tax=Pleurodeles waltl TaxID=8319 RepID=A0AAV7VJ96_PLEWA|nr:hypothetical protein NDU88_004550 [Pleurodeles waltl]